MNTENKLPEEFKQKWVAALRSGEYKQGQSLLHDTKENCFCCLGVACHIAVGSVPKGYYFIPPHTEEVDVTKVPDILRGGYGIAMRLAQMNDGAGEWFGAPMNFSEIADYIEQNL